MLYCFRLDITDVREQEETFCICDECGVAFTRPWLLKQHQKSLHLRELENVVYVCSFCSLRYDTEIGLKEHFESVHAAELDEIKQEPEELIGELHSAEDYRENDERFVWYYGSYRLKDLRVCLERIDVTPPITVKKEIVDCENPTSSQQNLEGFADGFQDNCTDSSLDGVNCREEDDVPKFESGLLTSGNDADLQVEKSIPLERDYSELESGSLISGEDVNLQQSELIPSERDLSEVLPGPLTSREDVNLQESGSIALDREDADLQELESDILVNAADKVEKGISSVIPMEPHYTKAAPQSKKHLEGLGHNSCLGRFIASYGGEKHLRSEPLLKTTNRSV